MKLECPVVRDLYILYKENELSREVREAVNQHLESCSGCKNIYEGEKDFSDILKSDAEEQPSKNLDEKIMLKLKVARLKAGILFIASIFFVTTFFNYTASRYNLLYDISQAEHSLHQMSFKIGDIKNKLSPVNGFMEDIQELNEQHSIIRRDLNLIEKNALKKGPNDLFMNFKVSSAAEVLKLRYKNGTFTERDEKAYSLLSQYMNETLIMLENARMSLNKLHGYGKIIALARPVDIGKISESYNKINQLALIYSQYNKFPDEISPMTQAELKKRIKCVLDMEDLDIKFHQNVFDAGIRLNGNCDFDGASKENNLRIYGTIDAYTGKLQRLQVNNQNEEGELLPLDKVKDNLQTFLNREYGNYVDFNIEYLGINHNFHSNVDIKLYSFKVYPVYKGYKVNIPLIVYFDARTSYIHSTMINASYDFIIPEYTIDIGINVKPETGLKKLEEQIDNLQGYAYLETSIIKSKLSGKYVLVHVYENEYKKVYVNCSTGIQEFSY